MSYGIVCVCDHYKDHHSENGRCNFEWRGKTCDCKEFKERENNILADWAKQHPESVIEFRG